ncbi:WD40 repeat-like protein [Suillus decipiens]|nr:WD40 repeat-like protein [Suillus decipiens]
MASASTKAATTKLIMKPVRTLKGHGDNITSISYFPDGQRIISGSYDKTTRQWDLETGKEIEDARVVFEKRVFAVAVSRDGRWVITGGDTAVLKAWEVETGNVKTFNGHASRINCIDISSDSTLLASGSNDRTARIWNWETGKLVGGPFKSDMGQVGAVRFSKDLKKLAVKLGYGKSLQVWDIQSQKLDVRIGKRQTGGGSYISPVFWTNKNKTIIAAFTFGSEGAKTIYEFDALTLETVGTSFEGHTEFVRGLALSLDGTLLVSSSDDETIKLWAFKSRELLASFDIHTTFALLLSPNSRQLIYATYGNNIYICDTPPDIVAQARNVTRKKSPHKDLLNSDATRRHPAGHRKPPISAVPIAPRPPPARDSQQLTFLRLSKFLRFSSRTVKNDQPRDPLDVPATSPLPPSLPGRVPAQFDHSEINSPPSRSNGVLRSLRQHLSFLEPKHSHRPPVVEVAPNRKVTRLLAAKLPEYKKVDDTRHQSSQQAAMPQENDTADVDSLPDVHWCMAFLCYYSCWSHGRLRMPPRWRLERVDIPRQGGTENTSRGGAHGRS